MRGWKKIFHTNRNEKKPGVIAIFKKFLSIFCFYLFIFNSYFPNTFFSTVQHGDPVTHTCTHSTFARYHFLIIIFNGVKSLKILRYHAEYLKLI